MASYVCPVQLSGALNSRLRKLLHDPKNIMGEYVHQGFTAADIGCGPGYFTLALADMVGEEGRVIAVDIQKEMLSKLKARTEALKLQSRISLHQCSEDKIGINAKLDFVLAFWMVHEVPDPQKLFAEIVALLKPEGLFLMVEPLFHTSAASFRDEVIKAQTAGLTPYKEVKVSISRAMLFSLPGKTLEPMSE